MNVDNQAQPEAPPSDSTTNRFDNVRRLLSDAKERKPTDLELELVELFLTGKDAESDRSPQFSDFVSTVLKTALRWKQSKFVMVAFRRLVELGTVALVPKVVFEVLCIVDWDDVNPRLSQLLQSDTPHNTRASLSLLESLEELVVDESSPFGSRNLFQKWAQTQRQRLCSALPVPQDRIEEIKLHCLQHGGLSYMKHHLLPLYTKLNLETGDLLCQLATRVDSDSAFPDAASKAHVVSSLLRAGVGQLTFGTTKQDDNIEEEQRNTYTLLSTCLKYECSEQVDALFEGIVQAVQRKYATVLDILDTVVVPLVNNIYSRLKADTVVLLERHIHRTFEAVMEAVVSLLREDPKWSFERFSGIHWGKFCAGFAPLWSRDNVLQNLLAKACCTSNLELASPEAIRTYISIVSDCSTTGSREQVVGSDSFKSLLLHYAAHAASEELTSKSVAEIIWFLSKHTQIPSALTSFTESLITSCVLKHNGSCYTAIVQKQLDVSASAVTCSCGTQLSFESLLSELEKGIPACQPHHSAQIKSICPALRIIVSTWFRTHLLVDPPLRRQSSLQRRLDELHSEWNCDKPRGRRACHLVRDFVCGTVCRGYSTMIIEDPGRRISDHLRDHMGLYLPQDLVDGSVKRGSIVVRKRNQALWMPERWAQLQAVGKRILKQMRDLTRDNEDLVREVIGDTCQDIRDAVENPKHPESDGEDEDCEDEGGSENEAEDEEKEKAKDEQGKEGGGEEETSQRQTASAVDATSKAVHVRDGDALADANEPPQKKQRTT